MREIIFRGKTLDKGEWVYGVPVIAKDNIADKDITVMVDNPNEIVPREGLPLFEQVDPETVGQYTGLKDKNGKRIFENGYMIIDNQTYKVKFDIAEYILTNIFDCDTITLKENSIKGVFVDEI